MTLPADRVAELVDDYQAGASVEDLAARFGIHRATVAQPLHRNGVPIRHRGLDGQQINPAVQLYQPGHSLTRIGSRVDVHAEIVRQVLRARGIQLCRAWERG